MANASKNPMQHATRYSTVTEPPTDKKRVIVMCAGSFRKHVSLPPEFKVRIEGVGVINENNVAKSIKSKSVDYVIVISRDISLAMPRDIVPIYIWRGSANSLSDAVYELLGLPPPARASAQTEPVEEERTSPVESGPPPWSEDEKAAIQIAYEKVGAAVVSEMFPIFREALPDGPSRTLESFFKQCQRQFGQQAVTMSRAAASAGASADDDPEVLDMLAAAERLRAAKQAARREEERRAREREEEERREAERQAKREAAERAEAARLEAARLEAERLAREREERRRAEREAAARVEEERRAAAARAEEERRAAEEAEARAEAALTPAERAERATRQHEVIRSWVSDPEISRNARCPCGKTDKKFKLCCLQKFNEREAQLREEQRRQASEQQFREQFTTSLTTTPRGETVAPLDSLAGALLTSGERTLDKVSALGRGIVVITERLQELDDKCPTKTDFSQLAELVRISQRSLADKGPQPAPAVDQLVRDVKNLAKEAAAAFNVLRDELGGFRNDVADLQRELGGLKREIADQTTAAADTLDTVVKLAENIVFLRNYVLKNLPGKAQ